MEVTLNGESREVADGMTVAGLLDELKLTGRPVAVEVNRDLVPRAAHGSQALCLGDEIEIVTLVGGG